MTALAHQKNRKSIRFNMARSVVKLFIPAPARDFLHTTHRAVTFRRAMKKFLWNLEHEIPFDRRVISDLIYGWGNEAWSADAEYLLSCLQHAQACRGPILECGSGLSTLLIGAVVQKFDNILYSLEHQSDWGNRVAAQLVRYGIDSVYLHVQPLKEYADFTWYEPPSVSVPGKYALVVCDGPPGATHGGRYGLIPVMNTQLAPGCVILLDDASRIQERIIASRWSEELGIPFETLGRYETLGLAKSYIRFELSGNEA